MKRRRLFLTGGSGFIGTNFVASLDAAGWEVLNFDAHAPLDRKQEAVWREGDILDPDALGRALAEFRPEAVVHMAARTDCDERTVVEPDYRVNSTGTLNVVEAVRDVGGIERFIMVSTQFVIGPGITVSDPYAYAPHTVYGMSKVAAELIVRAAHPAPIWCIARPTNVWGPWHLRYEREFWAVARKGRYVHPGGRDPVRTYGYVGNVCWQLERLLDLPAETVHEGVFYLGDRPAPLGVWADGFNRAFRGRRAPRLPRGLLAGLAVGMELLARLGVSVPLRWSRFKSMTTDYVSPTEETIGLLGAAPFSAEEGIRRTVEWIEGRRAGDGAPERPSPTRGASP